MDAACYGLNQELDFWAEQHKPVMMSEYGADTVAGLHTAGAEMFSEEFQVEFYRRLDAEFDKRPWFVGEFVWNFADYDTVQGPMRVDGNKKGLFTRDRRPKLGMHFLRQRWQRSRPLDLRSDHDENLPKPCHDRGRARQALTDACRQVETNLPLYTYQCQNHSSVNNIYPGCANSQWTCGFWPGEIWLAYEATGRRNSRTPPSFRWTALPTALPARWRWTTTTWAFCTAPPAWQRGSWWAAKPVKRRHCRSRPAADPLPASGRFLQAWGAMDDPGNYRYIIDCMLNVPLLYWAAQVTGSDHYREIAAAHTATTLANSFRPDGSTYHTFFMNPDGTPKGGRTCQGYKDDSFWARGQAWGVYGSAIGYTYTHDEKFLEVFRKALDFYLSRLPEDMIPCWDMLFAPESGEPRDSSSAAIVACGLLEAAKYVDEAEAAQWRTLARQMLASLAANYAVKPGTLGSGQLLHGTYSKKSPYNTCTPEGVDECTSWGDYFYMEALTRLTKDWEMYW